VTGFKLRSNVLQAVDYKLWNFQGLTGIVLVCGESGDVVFSPDGNKDSYSVARQCPCQTAVNSVRIRTAVHGEDNRILNTLNMYCDTDTVLIGSGQHKGQWHHKMECPEGDYVCGAEVVYTLASTLGSVNFKCCSGRSVEKSSKKCNSTVTYPDPRKWAPTYHFDPENLCYPDPIDESQTKEKPEYGPVSEYYGKCRKTLKDDVPIYYTGTKCGTKGYKLHYWIYYGDQKPCFLTFGAHAGDWEHVRLNFVLCGTRYCIDSVTYHQHSGWFTVPYVENEESTVHVWVAQIGHASYPTSCSKYGSVDRHERCMGGCLYFDDYHRANGVTWKPHNINPDPSNNVKICNKDPISCEAQSCERNQWFFG